MKRDTVTGIVGIAAVLVLFLVMQTLRQVPNLIEPGPRLMPTVGLLVILLSSIMLLIHGIRDKAPEKSYFPKGGGRRTAFAFLELVIYAICLEVFGFLISTPFAMFAFVNTLKGDEKVKWWFNVLISIAVTAFLYAMFVLGFQIKLPVGILFR